MADNLLNRNSLRLLREAWASPSALAQELFMIMSDDPVAVAAARSPQIQDRLERATANAPPQPTAQPLAVVRRPQPSLGDKIRQQHNVAAQFTIPAVGGGSLYPRGGLGSGGSSGMAVATPAAEMGVQTSSVPSQGFQPANSIAWNPPAQSSSSASFQSGVATVPAVATQRTNQQTAEPVQSSKQQQVALASGVTSVDWGTALQSNTWSAGNSYVVAPNSVTTSQPNYGSQPIQSPMQQSAQPIVHQSAQPLVQQSAQPIVQQPVQLPVQQPIQSPMQQTVQPPMQQSVQLPTQQSVQLPVQQPIQSPMQQTVQPPVQNFIQPLVQQPVASYGDPDSGTLSLPIPPHVAPDVVATGQYQTYQPLGTYGAYSGMERLAADHLPHDHPTIERSKDDPFARKYYDLRFYPVDNDSPRPGGGNGVPVVMAKAVGGPASGASGSQTVQCTTIGGTVSGSGSGASVSVRVPQLASGEYVPAGVIMLITQGNNGNWYGQPPVWQADSGSTSGSGTGAQGSG